MNVQELIDALSKVENKSAYVAWVVYDGDYTDWVRVTGVSTQYEDVSYVLLTGCL